MIYFTPNPLSVPQLPIMALSLKENRSNFMMMCFSRFPGTQGEKNHTNVYSFLVYDQFETWGSFGKD